MSNLPSWQGAAAAYGRAYRILAEMGRGGHVRLVKVGRRTVCVPSVEMDAAIDALNKGDEERVKGFNLANLHLDPELKEAA